MHARFNTFWSVPFLAEIIPGAFPALHSARLCQAYTGSLLVPPHEILRTISRSVDLPHQESMGRVVTSLGRIRKQGNYQYTWTCWRPSRKFLHAADMRPAS